MGCVNPKEEYVDTFSLPVSLQNTGGGGRRCREQLMDIIKHPQLSLLFREYLRSIYSAESYEFFMDVEEYKELTDPEEMRQRAAEIYEKYFTVDAEHEVNLEGSLKEMLRESIKRPDAETFELVLLLVLMTLEGDCLHKFLQSEIYKDFITDPMTRKVFVQGLPRTRSVNQILKYVDKMNRVSSGTA